MPRVFPLFYVLSTVLFLSGVLPPLAHAFGGGQNQWHGISIFGAMACFSFWRLWKNVRRFRAIEDTPTAKVASTAQGDVELSGTAEAVSGKPQVCPLTGTSCLWYFFKIERYERRGKNSSWVTVSSGRSTDVFGLRDNTGLAVVVPFNADVTSRRHRQWRGSTPSPLAGPSAGGLFSGGGSYRYTQDLILPGDPVYVLGWFETLSGLPASGTSLIEKLRQIKRNPKELLSRYDLNKDGEISLEEWDAARSSIEAELQRQAATSPTVPDVHTLHFPPPESQSPFLISTFSQEELLVTYKRRALLWVTGFFVFGSLTVYFLFP
jgi:hypothetical protein